MNRYLSTLLLLSLTAFAIPVQASPDIEHWTTANGARVYLVQAPELPMVNIQVLFDAGSARDGAHPGIGVLTNALLAEGNGGISAEEVSQRFEAVGAQFGNDSLRDMAFVSLRTLTERPLFDQALDTLALVLSRPEFPAVALERERNRLLLALKEEDESPGDIASKRFYESLYGDHPYGSPVTGSAETLNAITRRDVVDHYRRLYVGRNAVVAIVGAVDRKSAERLAERAVGGLPAGSAPPELPPVPDLATAQEIALSYPSSQTHILIGQPGMARGDADYFPLYVGNHILGGSGLVSRISDEVREQRGLAYSAYSYFLPMHAPGPFIVGLQTRNSQRGEALKVVRDTLARFVAEGPTAQELEQSKRNITGGFPLKVDSNKDILNYLGVIGFYRLPLDYLDRFNARVEAVTREQIRDAFRRRVHPERLVTVTVGGSG